MKYMRRGLVLLMAFTIAFMVMPAKAENISGDGEGLTAGESLPGEEDQGSVSGDTVSSPNGGNVEPEKLTTAKLDVVEMAVNEMEGIQPYATGDIASGTDGNISWVIDADGKLTVTGTGDFTGSGYNRIPWFDYRNQITSAKIDVMEMTNASSLFDSFENLENIDLSGFDTSRVTDMRRMFFGCSSLESLDLSKFDTSQVMDMSRMFAWCKSLESLDLGGFDTSQVTNMEYMFDDCGSLLSLDVSGFNTSQVTDMEHMFIGCSSLLSLDVSGFNTSQVTDMRGMFWNCSSLTSLDVSGFNTSQVMDMEFMFSMCNSLAGLDVSGFDTSQVTGMGGMFNQCNRLASLDVGGFDTSQVTDMEWMFASCSSLTSLDVSRFDTSQVTDMGHMFAECCSLLSLEVSGFDTSQVTDMVCMFSDCSSLTSLEVSGFDTTRVTDMAGMFSDCSSLTSLEVSGFDTSQVTDMRTMFGGCRSLLSLDVSGFDTSQVTDMGWMFANCDGLTSLDLSGFDMLNATSTYTEYMFSDCDNLTIIHTPRNLTGTVNLPMTDDTDIWRLPDDTEITELPRNLGYSVVITRYRNPKIITETQDLNMSDVIRVKYVPYSYTVQTNNWDPDNIVTYSIEKGTLAKGLQIYPATGEIYGMPLEAGEFPITVKATFSNPRYLPSYKDLTLTVLDNTDSNVWNAFDLGYEVEQYVGILVSGSCPVLTELTDQLFVSTGTYREFIDFWLNGEKLVEGRDYTKEEGSTRITIRSQTFKEKADKNGVNTIAAEFRVGGNMNNALKRTAQNFRIKEQTNGNSGNSDGNFESGGSSKSGSGGSGQNNRNTAPVPALQATAVVRLSAASGAPLAGMQLELHSTPMEATTNADGVAIFNNVEKGWHILNVKDTAGNLLASKGFEILFGERETMNGDQITVKAGSTFTLNVQMDGSSLLLIGTQEKEAPQVMQQAQSADTGDSAELGVWFVLFISFGILLTAFFWRKRRTRIKKY